MQGFVDLVLGLINPCLGCAFAIQQGIGVAAVMSDNTGKQISQRVDLVAQAIDGTVQIAERYAHLDEQVMRDSDQVIRGMLDVFRETSAYLSEAAADFQKEGFSVQQTVSGVIVSLQFQDRIS